MHQQFVKRGRKLTAEDGSVIHWQVPGQTERSFLISIGVIPTDPEAYEVGGTKGIIELSSLFRAYAVRVGVKSIETGDGQEVDLKRERVPFAGLSVNILTDECAADLMLDQYPDEMEQISDEWIAVLNEFTEAKKNESEAQSQHSTEDASAGHAGTGSGVQATTKPQGNLKAVPPSDQPGETTDQDSHIGGVSHAQ